MLLIHLLLRLPLLLIVLLPVSHYTMLLVCDAEKQKRHPSVGVSHPV